MEDRPYRPHLTLARVSGVPRGAAHDDQTGPLDLAPIVERLRSFRSPGWLAGEVELFTVAEAGEPAASNGGSASHAANGTNGSNGTPPYKRYERVGHWPLTGR
jgi:hypothetical protein